MYSTSKDFRGISEFLEKNTQILENRVNLAFVIKWPIQIRSVYHKICYCKIQITKQPHI